MTTLFSAGTRLDAWFAAIQALESGGPALNVILSIDSPETEGPAGRVARTRLDEYYVAEKQPPLHTIAETIFPAWEYRHRGIRGVFETYKQAFAVLHAADPKAWGTYAYRLVHRLNASGEAVNPLEKLIEKMRSERNSKGGGAFRACYELGVAEGEYDLPLYNSVDDQGRRRGAPCLSHLSFKLWQDSVHLMAVYRSHDYAYKVPGNLLGLARLQACVAHEVGVQMGGLVVHSTYAYAQTTKTRLRALISDIGKIVAAAEGRPDVVLGGADVVSRPRHAKRRRKA